MAEASIYRTPARDRPHGPLGDGAAEAAPTAPHATPRARDAKASGPERFWAHWPVRVALAGGLVVSGVAHCAVFPLDVPHSFEVKDTEGEAAIPIDVLSADEPEPPPPPPALDPGSEAKTTEPDKGPQAVLPKLPDAGAHDAAADALADGPPDAPHDAAADGPADGAPEDAGADGEGTGGAVASLEGGAPATGPRDPQAILGAAGSVQADVVLVMVVVNAEVIRKNPVGARMGYLLRGIPQWDEFMSGTDIDPVRDTDWVMISGPSLVNTTRDVVMIHYAASDAAVDKAVDVVSAKYDKGGPYDAGVPGVRAKLAHADRGERVLLRPQPHVLAVVPPSVADKVARQLVAAKVPPHIRPGEAAYVRVVNPHHPIPEIPDTISEMRLRVVPRADDGADVYLDGDTKDPADATVAADTLRAVVRRHNDGLTSLLTHGLLDHVEVTPEGSQVRLHLTASRDQIETLVTLVGDFLGVKPGGAVVPLGSTAPKPSR
jgi:hypothetical protein